MNEWIDIAGSRQRFLEVDYWLINHAGQYKRDWNRIPSVNGLYYTRIEFANSSTALIFALRWSNLIVRQGEYKNV